MAVFRNWVSGRVWPTGTETHHTGAAKPRPAVDRVAIEARKDYTHPSAVQSACLCFEWPGPGPARPGRAFSGPLLISTGCQAELNPPADLRIQSVRQECKTRVPTRGRGRASGPPRKFTACVDDGGAAFALFTSCPSPAPEC